MDNISHFDGFRERAYSSLVLFDNIPAVSGPRYSWKRARLQAQVHRRTLLDIQLGNATYDRRQNHKDWRKFKRSAANEKAVDNERGNGRTEKSRNDNWPQPLHLSARPAKKRVGARTARPCSNCWRRCLFSFLRNRGDRWRRCHAMLPFAADKGLESFRYVFCVILNG